MQTGQGPKTEKWVSYAVRAYCLTRHEKRVYKLVNRFTVEKFAGEVVDAFGSGGVREGDESDSGPGIVAHEAAVPAGASVMPDDRGFAVAGEHVPGIGDIETGGSGRLMRLDHGGHRGRERGLYVTEIGGEEREEVVGGGSQRAGAGERGEVPIRG